MENEKSGIDVMFAFFAKMFLGSFNLFGTSEINDVSFIPASVTEEYNKRCEGKTEEEKKAVLEEMKQDNPFVRNFFNKINDKEACNELFDSIKPIEEKIAELEMEKFRLMKEWINKEE